MFVTGKTDIRPQAPDPHHHHPYFIANDWFVSSGFTAESVVKHVSWNACSGKMFLYSSLPNGSP